MKFELKSRNQQVNLVRTGRSVICAVIVFMICHLPALAGVAGQSQGIDKEFFEVLRGGNVRQLQQALDKAVSVNGRDSVGNTPLMLSAVYGDIACVRLLVERGADVNATNQAGATALMRSAFDTQKVRYLVDHGANVNARSALGHSALMIAARPWNSHEAVEYLLGHGANARATNYSGATALMAAAAGGDEK